MRNYSMMDLQGLVWLSTRLSRGDPIDKHLIESMLVSYKGHTVFSIFEEEFHEAMLDFILQYLYDKKLSGEIDEYFEKDSTYIRRIYRVMTMPTSRLSVLDDNNQSGNL